MTNDNPNKHLLFTVHGAGMHGGVFAGLAPHLIDYRLYTPSLPGHSTDGVANDLLPTIQDMAGFIKEQLDNVPVEDCVLIGHSMGGLVALAAADHEKVKGLILLGTGVTMPVHPVLLEEALEQSDEAQKMILKWGVNAQHPQLNAVQEAIGTFMNDVPSAALGVGLKACDRFDATELAKSISKPTLIITGEQDLMVPPNRGIALSSLIKGSVFEYIPDAGHMLMIESPEDTSLKINAFLENLSWA